MRPFSTGPRHAPTRGLPAILAAALCVLALHPPASRAQSIRGEAVDRETGRPVPGAVVLLLDSADSVLAGMLADTAGRFLVHAPDSGTYRLLADRVGYRTANTPPIRLQRSVEVAYRLTMDARAIPLEGLTVEGQPRCTVRPYQGLAAHTVWEEARKALNAALWSERSARHQFRIRLYERELDRRTLAVRSQESRVVSGPSSAPFRSAPVEQLATDGFVVSSGRGYTYYAPDAEALLSNHFLDSHCFRVVSDDRDPALVGLAFEPVRDVAVPDVAGVLWLERSSSRLRHLEFHYVGAPQDVGDANLGGRVEFDQLPTGEWITRRWYIRMPLVRAQTTWLNSRSAGPSARRVSIKEDGGEVVSVRIGTGRTMRMGEAASLGGTVFDSIRRAPAAGARVYLRGTEYETWSGEDGAFEFADLSEGTYAVAFSHPTLDSLGVAPREREVGLGEGERRSIHLAIPSPASIERDRCEELGERGAVLYGTVHQEGTSWALPGVAVRLVAPREFGSARADSALEQRTDHLGSFRFCGVRTNVELTLSAEVDARGRGETSVTVGPGEVVEKSVEVRLDGSALTVRLPNGQVLRASRRPTTARGQVVDAVDGAVLEGASVRLRPLHAENDLSLRERRILTEVGLERETDRRGRFATDPLPAGPYEVVVQREGYLPYTTRIVLTGAAGVDLTVSLARAGR